MKNKSHEELDGSLLDAVRQLTSDGIDSGMPPDLNDEVLSRLESFSHPNMVRTAIGRNGTPQKRGRIMFLTKIGSMMAAMAIALGLFTIWDSSGSSNELFAHVAARLATIQSLTCRVQFETDANVEMVDGEFGDKVTFLAPSLHRVDRANGSVEIIDTENDVMAIVNHSAKESLTITGNAAKIRAAASPAHLIDVVRSHLSMERVGHKDVVEIEGRAIDGVQAIGLRSTLNGQVLEAWCDSARQLPLLIRMRFTLPTIGDPKTRDVMMWRVLSDFEYDGEIDPELFSTTPPDGYKSVQIEGPDINPAPSELADIVSLFRICSAVNCSVLPLSLQLNDDEGTPMAIMHQYAAAFDKQYESADEVEQKEMMKKVAEFGAVLGRSQAFLLNMTKKNDLQYFGGAKLNDADRPVFWYSPEGNQNYKVVYADMSIRDATRDTLPARPAQPESPGSQRAATVRNLKEFGRALHNSQENVIEVKTPKFELPPHEIRTFDELQAIRQSGRQSQVEYLAPGLMPEFIDSQVKHVAREDVKLVEVQPDWAPDRTPESERFEFLKEFPNLRGIDAMHLYLTHRDLKAIASCSKLQRLSLSGVKVHEETSRRLSGDDLKVLSGLMELQVLDLSQANFAGGLMHLSNLPALNTLFLTSFENLNDRSFAELKELPHLRTLAVGPVYGTNPEKTVTLEGLRSLQKLPSLRNLFVGYHGKWTLPVDKLRELLPNVKVVPPR